MLMLKTATVLEAISKRRRAERPAAHTGLSKNTIFATTHSADDALVLLGATANGLTAEHAAERLNAVGPNTIEAPTKTLARRIADAFVDPFAGILAALALVSLYIDVLAVPEPQRDPSTVIVEASEVHEQEQMDQLGMNVIPVDLRGAYAFGGGLHCSTADVYREGECLDYFPNRVKDCTLIHPEMWED